MAAPKAESPQQPFRGRRVTRPAPGKNWFDYDPKPIARKQAVQRLHATANDNRPSRKRGDPVGLSNDGPADGHLDSVAIAGDDKRYGKPGTRIERALAKSNPVARRSYVRLREALRPADHANDNGLGEYLGGVGHLYSLSTKPSIPALLRAFVDGMRSRVTVRSDGAVERLDGGIHFDLVDGLCVMTVGGECGDRFHGLRFVDGALHIYSDSKGRRKKPDVRAGSAAVQPIDDDSLTAKHLLAEQKSVEWMLTRQPACAYEPTMHADAAGFEPAPKTRRAAVAQRDLEAAYAKDLGGVRWSFHPAGVAAEYGRLAGVPHLKGRGASRAANSWIADNDRADAGEALLAEVDDDLRDKIEAIVDADTFADIGRATGYAESGAHKQGRRVCEQTLEKISERLAA